MKILETSDTRWIEEMEALIKEMLSLAEHMDRDLGMEDYRKHGGPPRYGRFSTEPRPLDMTASQYYMDQPVGRYHGSVSEFQHRAERVLKQKKEKMG